MEERGKRLRKKGGANDGEVRDGGNGDEEEDRRE